MIHVRPFGLSVPRPYVHMLGSSILTRVSCMCKTGLHPLYVNVELITPDHHVMSRHDELSTCDQALTKLTRLHDESHPTPHRPASIRRKYLLPVGSIMELETYQGPSPMDLGSRNSLLLYKKSSQSFVPFRELLFLHKHHTMVVLLKTTSVRVSFIQIMQIRVQNKKKSVRKRRYDGDVSTPPILNLCLSSSNSVDKLKVIKKNFYKLCLLLLL